MEAPDVVRPPRDGPHGRRMTDVEALMWNVEKDPYLDPTFGSLTLFDTVPDLALLRPRLVGMVEHVPRLRQRVVSSLGRLAPPEWQDDPDFELDHHIRHIALPAPGTMRQLLDLAVQLVQDPLDRSRPLWEFVVVEGLEGGRGALVQKMHHTITDGLGGIRMSERFVDLERHPPPPDDAPPPRLPTPSACDRPGLLEATGDVVGHTFRRTLGLAQRAATAAAGTAAGSLRDPAVALRVPSEAVELARSTLRQVTVTDRAHSPLWTERSLRRRLEVLRVPFDEAHTTAKALGGSLNDLFVTAVAGGVGAYHRELGAPVETLRMAMPVSTRRDRSAGGNSFVPTRVLVPTGQADPVERFEAVRRVLDRTKRERVLGVVDQIAGLANLLPTSLLTRVTREQARTIDFTTSNVRAAPFELFVGGARIEATYPLGPLSSTAFNLTMMSYCGSLDMGLHLDAGAVPEPELLRDRIADGFEELFGSV